MDRIIIKNILAYGILGILPDERVNRQPIIVNLTLDIQKYLLNQASCSDHINDAVDYSKVCDLVVNHIETASDQLIEKLIIDITRLIFNQFPPIEKVKIKIEKPTALKFAEAVGIEIERVRADFNF
jgi:7,8-dihydroneopterin aldolase/epimerase/oxygenase